MVKPKRHESPEITWDFSPRIEPGHYPAYSRSASVYRDKSFKRWVCAVQFDVVSESLVELLARLTWYLNLGGGDKPHAGKRGNFWAAWVRANGNPPARRERMTPHVFKGRYAVIAVADTVLNHKQKPVRPEEAYSVIRDVIEWKTGGKTPCF